MFLPSPFPTRDRHGVARGGAPAPAHPSGFAACPASLARATLASSQLKHRIHNTRFPIKDKRLLAFVKCLYFVTPVVFGYLLMECVKPDPEEIRARLQPSELSIAMSERNKRGLGESLAAAEAEATRRQEQRREGPEGGAATRS